MSAITYNEAGITYNEFSYTYNGDIIQPNISLKPSIQVRDKKPSTRISDHKPSIVV
uniref:Uncharacterized protein n=1 Tax=viral metagenome TaxID=1070528 RepID=A0A6M3K7W5_9ZZZZ